MTGFPTHVERFVTVVALAAILALVIINLVNVDRVRVAVGVIDPGVTATDVNCDTSRQCAPQLYDTDYASCSAKYLGKQSTCAGECVVNGHCDGLGTCQPDTPKDCFGWCDAGNSSHFGPGGQACDDLFAWNVEMEGLDNVQTFGVTWCLANKCVGFASFYIADGTHNDVQNGYESTVMECEDLLDATFFAVNGSCLTIRRDVLAEPIAGTVSVLSCRYFWTCGMFNQSWIDDYTDD